MLKQTRGEAIIYKGDGSLNSVITGVFDEQYVSVHPETGLRVTESTPSFLYATADLPEIPAYRSQFEIRGHLYLLSRIEADGHGGARVFLADGEA